MILRSRLHGSLLIGVAIVAAPFLASPAQAAANGPGAAKKYEANADALIAKNDFKGAAVELKNAAKAAPDDPKLRLKLVDIDLRLNDFDDAQIELKAARDDDADETAYIPLRARTYIIQGKFQQLLQEMLPRDDAPPEIRAAVLVARADAQMGLKKVDDARSSLTTAERLLPQSATPKLGLARIALNQNQIDYALKKADEVIQIAPSAEAHILKGEIFQQRRDLQGALAEFSEAVKADPNNVGGFLERAQTYIALNQDDKAEGDVEAALASAPRLIQANYLEALIKTRRKDFNGADTILTRIAPAFPNFPRGFYLQAIVKSGLKQYEQAETSITTYLTRVPNDPLGEKVMADTLLHKGDPNGAAEYLEKVASQTPDDFQALTLLGQAYMRADKPQQAVEVFERAGKLKPDDPSVLRGLALNHLAEGLSSEGTSELEKTLQIAPNDQPAGETLVAIYIRQREFGKAAKLVADMRKRQPNEPVPSYMAGQLELVQFHLPAADAAFKATEKQFPDFIPAKLQIAYIAAVQNRIDDAANVYEEILAQTPGNLQALQNLSILLESQKQPDQIVDIWQKAYKAQPDSLPIGLGVVRAYMAKKDFDLGLTVIRDMQLRQPNEPQLYTMRAQLELAKSAPKDAVTTLQRLVEMRPQDATAKQELAVAQERAGDVPTALATIGEARKLDPNNMDLVAHEIRLTGLKNPDEGIAAAQKVAGQMPDQPRAQVLEGDYLVLLKRPADAKAAYERAFAAHPSLLLAERFATTAKRDGKVADGIKILNSWATTHPDDLKAKFDLANYYLSQKSYKEAKANYETVLKAGPDNALVLNNLAFIYQQTGNAPQALELAKKANAVAPQDSNVADTLGWIMVQQGDIPNGLKYLQQARTAAPDNLDVQYHVAVALFSSGQKVQAAELLKNAMAAGHDFDSKSDAASLLADIQKN